MKKCEKCGIGLVNSEGTRLREPDMKFSLATILFLLSFATLSFASTSDHAYKAILRDIPLSNACITATEVRSIQPVRTCIQLEPADILIPERPNITPSWTCRQYADVQLVYPRSITTEKCVRYAPVQSAELFPIPECLETRSQTLFLPSTIEVSVFSSQNDRPSRSDVVRESFTFPKCK